tara:strand:- start:411 stop:791 length:381 start_codon:yes stop_codon:yes gene_type:complete
METEKETIQERSNKSATNWIELTQKEMKEFDSIMGSNEFREDDEETLESLEQEITNNYGIEKKTFHIITLSGGGPASRVIYYGEDQDAQYQFQDWGEPWTTAELTEEQQHTLNLWCGRFFEYLNDI